MTSEDDIANNSNTSSAEELVTPAYTSEMNDCLQEPPPRALEQEDRSKRPGKLKFVGSRLPPKMFSALETQRMAESITKVIRIADFLLLITELTAVFSMREPEFEMFGKALAEELGDFGIVVILGKRSLAFHGLNHPCAVQFKMDRELDFNTDSMRTILLAQTYDWNTKKNVQIDPPGIIEDLCKDNRLTEPYSVH